MADFAVIIAETEGGLAAVVKQSGYSMVEGSAKPFDSLTTRTSYGMTEAGFVSWRNGGWLALATAT